MIEKHYSHAAIEPRISAIWEKAGAFKAGKALEKNPRAAPFSIVIPPPNVTGSLHMGHALNNTLQDVLARFWRMRGRDVLWQPGTDHAGIATQSLVERKLMESQQPGRRDLGREAFLKRVWAWKDESGGTIVNQLKRLGASCDWSRERFTLGHDENDQMSRAVIKAFVDLYNEGLIYKDKRLVNWDPKLQTAISDLEVVSVEKRGTFAWAAATKDEKPFNAAAFAKVIDRDPDGHLYYFKYPLTAKVKGYKAGHIVVATTRPETMLGDMAVAVHPSDERYAVLVRAGARVRLPLADREIPIIADDYADPEQGTGAVKITPAHDFNDFEVGRRHNLAPLNILTPEAELGGDVPESYRGLPRYAARKKVVADLQALGLLEKIEPHAMKVPYGDRSNVAVEPYLTDQWYVKAEVLAEPALEAVRAGKTEFIPENWRTVYYQWLENIQPWCISRQLWWGHRIPAWYGPYRDYDGTYRFGSSNLFKAQAKEFVATSPEDAIQLAKSYYSTDDVTVASNESAAWGEIYESQRGNWQNKHAIWRDPDVLDTWFSSALWPFSTMGWPDETPELARYYPTSVLVTGFDIIFFWVARMMMMGMHFMRKERPGAPLEQIVPFRDVYIHALVRDEKGAKMSKSKGNVVDPLSIMEEYGADALRFTMAAMAAQGRDVKLSMQRIEGYRNFATKLWNAARFAEMNGCVRSHGFDPSKAKTTLNKWIFAEANAATAAVTASIEAYRFNEAAAEVYRFVWNIYCDWYLEFAKPVFMGGDEAAKAETQAMAAWTLDVILKVLHPFMPFITEELWEVLGLSGTAREGLLCLSEWPAAKGKTDAKAVAEVRWVIDLIGEIRSVRSEMNVPAAAQIPLTIVGAAAATKTRVNRYRPFLQRLAKAAEIGFAKAPPPGSAQFVLGEATVALELAGAIDIAAERERLSKDLQRLGGDVQKIASKLQNDDFIAKAPPEVVEENRERKADAEATMEKLTAALRRLERAAA